METSTPADTTASDVQTMTAVGRPAAHRFSSPDAVAIVYKDTVLLDKKDAQRRALLRSMVDGAPPLLDSDLEALGLKDLTNVNFLTMRGLLDGRALRAVQIASDEAPLIDLEPDYVALQTPNIRAFGDIVVEEFSRMVTDWAGFLPFLDRTIRDSDLYGLGPGMWPDEWDWRIKAVQRGSVKIPPMTPIPLDEVERIHIEGTLDVGFLVQLLDNQAAARGGWNVAGIRQYLVDTYVSKQPTESEPGNTMSTTPEESLQAMIRNNVWLESRQFDVVRVVHTLVKEVSSKRGVTHIIMPANDAEAAEGTPSDNQDGQAGTGKYWLYNKPHRYERMSHVFWWLPNNHGDGTARSVRGVGSFIAPIDDLNNRYMCMVYDSAYRAGKYMLQAKTKIDASRLNFVEWGPYIMLPPEMTVVQQQTAAPNLGALVQVREIGNNILQNNIGGLKNTSAGLREAMTSGSERKTKDEARDEIQARTSLQSAQHQGTVCYLTQLFQEMFRRAARLGNMSALPKGALGGYEEARRFVQNCLRRGVPEEIMKNLTGTFLVSAAGMLSENGTGSRLQRMNAVLQLRPHLDDEGTSNAVRDCLSALVGWRKVDRYKPPANRDIQPTDARSLAALENNSLIQGMPVKVGYNQFHVSHVQVHLEPIMQVLQAYQQKQIQDPQKAAMLLSMAIGHVAEHLQVLAKDPLMKLKVKQLNEFLGNARKVSQALAQQARQTAKARDVQQQRQQQVVAQAQQALQGRDVQAKMAEINTKYQLAKYEQDSLNRMRDQKTRVQNRIRVADALANIAIKAREAGEPEVVEDVRKILATGQGADELLGEEVELE